MEWLIKWLCKTLIALVLLLLQCVCAFAGDTRTWSLDDFEDGDFAAAPGPSWFALADDLIGGASEVRLEIRAGGPGGAGHVLALTGRLGGGKTSFAGAWVSLDRAGRTVDLGALDGLRLRVKSRLPLEVGLRSGSYNYMTAIEPGEDWRLVDVPFTELAPVGRVPEGTRFAARAEVFGITTPQLSGGETRAAGAVDFEIDDVVFYGSGEGRAEPVASGSPTGLTGAPFTPLGSIPKKGWVELARDPQGDGRQPALPDATRLEAIPSTADGMAKTLLFWIDTILVRGEATFRFAAGVAAWQAFISSLLYVAVAASAHAWLTARRLREEEAHAARAEMSALRAQLNPHFLFNVLHSVLGLVRRDPALAETALEDLGDLLHYAIRVHRDGVDWTPLRHEWEFMETYLELEKMRLGERLRATLHLDPAALDQAVPTFSLQPLVENAVRHAVAPRAAGGRVRVDSRIDGDLLRLEVRNDGDDGDGGGAQATENGDGPGLGLRVLRERLEVLYRGRARMSAGPTAEGGYEVLLALPRKAGGAEAAE